MVALLLSQKTKSKRSYEFGVITINSDNFYLETAIPKDAEIAQNAIGTNVKKITLNQINNGTQKLISGLVHSGDYRYTSQKIAAIGNNINNYSKTNSVTLTGTYVHGGVETEIEKTVEFDVDWYGEVKAGIIDLRELNEYNIENFVNEESEKLNLTFKIDTWEDKSELIPSKSHIEGTIPQYNGYNPLEVKITGTNVNYTYDTSTRNFIAERVAEVDENGNIKNQAYYGNYIGSYLAAYNKRYNKYEINIVYPIEAYREIDNEYIELEMPVIHRVIDSLTDGTWSSQLDDFKVISDEFLLKNDEYMVLADFDAYAKAHDQMYAIYNNKEEWAKKCLINIANSAYFSSDRAINEYAEEIWKIKKQ